MAKFTRSWQENGEEKVLEWDDGRNDGRHVFVNGPPPRRPFGVAPMVMSPFQEYKSVIDGTMITDRAQHRNHLKEHKCIELGNEWDAASKMPDFVEPKGVEDDVAQAIRQVGLPK